MTETPGITRLDPGDFDAALGDLADILCACVHAGASVGFIQPFDTVQARAFWTRRVYPAVRSGGTTVFVARQDNRITGTVQLGHDLMPNQPHRADVAKMLVHPSARRNGIARALLQTLESHAMSLGKSLLVLDTRSHSAAQGLYQSAGFQIAGEIPGYCRHPDRDVFEPTTYLYKSLA